MFLETLHRASNARKGVCVLFFRYSGLKAESKNTVSAMTLANELKLVAEDGDSSITIYILSTSDIFVVGRDLSLKTIEDMERAARRLFLATEDEVNLHGGFVRRFFLERDYSRLMFLMEKLSANAEKARAEEQKRIRGALLVPQYLDAILRNINNFNIIKLIRRQEAVQISAKGMQSLFFEYFTSMVDLKRAIAPDVDVLSNRWLFRYLSETLDLRMLGISQDLYAHTPNVISLNLNLSSLFTTEFDSFLKNLPPEMKIVAEIQLTDVFQNIRNFQTACTTLHERGHRILIDGLSVAGTTFLDFNQFDVDYVKLTIPRLDSEEDVLRTNAFALEYDPNKIILMRVESEEAIRWGLLRGITKFQGYFIDSVVANLCRGRCPNRANCTMPQCAACKARIVGALREHCQHQDRLDVAFEKSMARPS